MLIEILCDEFLCDGKPRGKIRFHRGLNTVLGTNTGSNSIGKSTFLMIIDFVFGGEDYVGRLTDVQTEVGAHTIKFAFCFGGNAYYFSRSTADFKVVNRCDSDYTPLPNKSMSVDEYMVFLQRNYGLTQPGVTLRNAVGRFIRVYNRDTLDEKHPLHTVKQETASTAITGLLKLANLFAGIEEHQKVAKDAKDKRDALRSAAKYQYIPSVSNQKEYDRNEARIAELEQQADELAHSSSNGLLDLDSMEAMRLSQAKGQLSGFKRQRASLIAQLHAIRADRGDGRAPRKLGYDDLLHFFPDVNIQRIEDIDSFHKKLAGILKEEFIETETTLQTALDLLEVEISALEEEISRSVIGKGLSKATLEQYATIDKELKTLRNANDNYIKEKELSEVAKAYADALDKLTSEQIAQMQQEINAKMKELNDRIYDGKKTAPCLSIQDASHYSFFTPRDGGTGTQYKGLIVFDLAMLALTNLPVVVHDSILLKQIADEALERIMVLYTETEKQVFIALDKEGAYTDTTREIMESTTVIRVGKGEQALFGRTWNDTGIQQGRQ
ncbi:MAG: DUF2326 domain-containing protein [Subdoligranulum variabile]|nr:MAG: DUF2326 domain-containing protein [Subdoligranulum variabile]